jgi:DNA-binding CsgD family transcriptional regulator
MIPKTVRLYLVLIPLFLCGFDGIAQPLIRGVIQYDTTRWKPVVSLSLIPDLSRMYEVSNEAIIQESPIGPDGTFSFTADHMPPGDHLYRIHFTRKEDPRASLVIGGPDENHLFLICDAKSEISIRISGRKILINRFTFDGYPVNRSVKDINDIAGFLDTLDFYGPAVNRDFVREAVYERLRRYADTCSNPLISLFALYHSRFESDFEIHPDYYHRYLRKWRKQESEYFTAFRAQLGVSETQSPWVPVVAAVLFLGLSGLYYAFRRKRKPAGTPYQTLTVQERKIFSMLKEGKTNKEISDICAISLSTVKTHVNSIYSKLGLQSRTDVMDYKTDQE